MIVAEECGWHYQTVWAMTASTKKLAGFPLQRAYNLSR